MSCSFTCSQENGRFKCSVPQDGNCSSVAGKSSSKFDEGYNNSNDNKSNVLSVWFRLLCLLLGSMLIIYFSLVIWKESR